METMDVVNGFQIPSPQVELARRIFEKHPEIASEFRLKNPNLRSGYMSLLLFLIDTLRNSSPHELTEDDLSGAYDVLKSMTNAGFQFGWLEKKLLEVVMKKLDEEDSEIRMQEIEEELKDLKLKCSDLQDKLKQEKAKVLAAKSPISFDDVI